MISRLLFYFGALWRNPSLSAFVKQLMQTDFASLEDLKMIQEKKLQELLDIAFDQSPYLKNKYNTAGIRREDIQSIADLSQLPSIDKDELRINSSSINSTVKFKKIFLSETSGTSGQPLKFNKNEEWDSMNRAAMFRGYSWYGVKPWDKNGYFWGYNIAQKSQRKIKILDWLQNRFRIFSYEKEEIIRFSQKLTKAKYLEGYSSMIYEVAKIINLTPNAKKPLGIKLIKGTSEKIYDNYHNETIKAFGSKIRSEYGAAEAGLIAFECPEGSMHINSENVLVEIEDGEILVTNLVSHSFPIIRYKLGDQVSLAPDNFKCKCGRQHPVIIDILGRVGKRLLVLTKHTQV
ncbi:hypothetical protein OKW96_04505 [Sphingobacterium sp. KU25419]|nr:hypothetical protein OKW96_04505 [Sphingobacterium sp. KU25419]